jgi:subtilisin family serine protease
MKRLAHGLLLFVCVLAAACENAPPVGESARVPIIITFEDPPEGRLDLATFQLGDRRLRRVQMVRALMERAERAQAPLRRWLVERGATEVRPLWVVNGIATVVGPSLARELGTLPGIRIAPDWPLTWRPAPASSGPTVPEQNLVAIDVPALWARGVDGSGVVVANMDTGVDVQHADLQSSWRGGSDGWWDPYRHTTAPYDALGHGTQAMGLLVAGSGGGTAIGVAPGAKWIAAKIYDDDGNTTVSVIHEAFQWLLAPSGDPAASDAPDVVSASWGLPTVDACDDTFAADLDALRAAGVLVVLAAGNSGPAPSTSISPANNAGSFSVGAVDATSAIASFSSRGASKCTQQIYPDLVAPGVDVKTTNVSLGGFPQYTFLSGTSAAAPQVAGVAALLLGAFPGTPPAVIEATLRTTAHDLGPVGPDDDYGYGLVDAWAAYQALSECRTQP